MKCDDPCETYALANCATTPLVSVGKTTFTYHLIIGPARGSGNRKVGSNTLEHDHSKYKQVADEDELYSTS
jgi:hypothetical protein